MSAADAETGTADREIVITRTLDAPRELVFDAWTDPDTMGDWWGPRGFTTTTSERDVRPGGAWRFVMHAPNGVDYPNEIIYTEIARPERLRYAHGAGGGKAEFQVTVTFEERGGGTVLTLRSLFPSAEERDAKVAFGAVAGGNQTLDRLEKYLAGRLPAAARVTS
jgi:uncharacterized protein YndB with AHSA1/START domain